MLASITNLNAVPTDPTRAIICDERFGFGFTCRISRISSSSWGFKQKRAEVETTNSPQDIVPSTVEVIRRRKHSSRRRIRPQITVGKSCWQFNGLDFCSVLICCCLLRSFFCPHAFHFQKDISHLSPSSLLTYMAAHSIFTPVSRDTSRAVTQCTNSNPNLAHLALAAAFHQRAEGVLARQSVFITASSVPLRDICPPQPESIWKRRCCECTPAAQFRS